MWWEIKESWLNNFLTNWDFQILYMSHVWLNLFVFFQRWEWLYTGLSCEMWFFSTRIEEKKTYRLCEFRILSFYKLWAQSGKTANTVAKVQFLAVCRPRMTVFRPFRYIWIKSERFWLTEWTAYLNIHLRHSIVQSLHINFVDFDAVFS